MNKYDLFRALGDIDEELLPDAEWVPMKKSRGRYWGILAAACLCVAALYLGARMLPFGTATDNAAGANETGGPRHLYSTNAESIQETLGQSEPRMPLEETTIQMNGAETWGPTTAQTEDPFGSGYGDIPSDFRFIITWPGGSFDSGTGLLSGDQQSHFTLSAETLQAAWNLVSGLEFDGTAEGDVVLTAVWDGVTRTVATDRQDYGAALSICSELVKLVSGTELE